jgi:F-type H+-transporting ATPase subunit b
MNLIDFRMVGTQILGFLLLLWALSKWAWGPITDQLAKRRQKIADEFAEAERRQQAADATQAKLEVELHEIEARARARLVESVAEGQKVAAEMRLQAQKEAQERLGRAAEEIAREREKAKELLKQQVIDLSLKAAEKILRTRLDDPAQRKLVGEFIDEVGAIH